MCSRQIATGTLETPCRGGQFVQPTSTEKKPREISEIKTLNLPKRFHPKKS